jgi:hypothetical protein
MGMQLIVKAPGTAGVQPTFRTAPAGRAAGRPATVLVLVALVCGLLPGACGRRVDSDSPFQMSLNGNRYLPGVGQPLAGVSEMEAGFNNMSRCTIIFPLNALKNHPQPGLEITFNPAVIPVGEEVSFGADGDDLGIQLSFHPFFGGMSNDGQMLVYSTSDQGSARIRFDDLDLEAGHVEGVLLEAVLWGHYLDAEGETTEPQKPMEMHLSNFPFDVKLSDGMW